MNRKLLSIFSSSVFLLLLGIIAGSSISLGFSLDFEFKDGEAVCKDLSSKITAEIPKWVSVPADYNVPLGPTTLIYAYTLKKFDPLKQSLIYFVGGPGGSSRGVEFSLPNMNVIFFEQRGISCSRPKTRELFLNPKFYSSENTANDALSVLDVYGVNKAAIYGHSYGTVPATIFASKFPERTQSLLLEGVIFKADESLWISPRKITYMENFFKALPKVKQDRILSFSNRADTPKTWFSFMARMALIVGNFQDGLTGFLNATLFAPSNNQAKDDAEFAAMLTSMTPKIDTTTPAEQNGFGEITMGMIACQEMNMANPAFSHLLYFRNGRLVPDRNNMERTSMCEPLGLANIQNQYYSAEKFHIHVPVTYFLGEFDPATSLDQGLNHFKNAQSSQKQALILKGGGHTPNIQQVLEAAYCDPSKENCDKYKQQQIQLELFEKAARAEVISDSDVRLYNAAGLEQWMSANP